MNIIDGYKLKIVVQQSKKQLQFLDHIKAQDDISSELAGYEISKLLKTQEKHEETYAELVRKRGELTGIAQKKELAEIESQIASVSAVLKESTKKLCKLFKENPDLERDSQKVTRERKHLIRKLEDLMGFVEASQVGKFQQYVNGELDSQDQLRQFIEKEKKLTLEIKQLQHLKNQENKEYQKEIREAQNKIQDLKETLMEKSSHAELQVSYDQKEKEAELSNIRRINEYRRRALYSEIEGLTRSIGVCTKVHQELKEYLTKTEREIKDKSEAWNDKAEKMREELDKELKELQDEIADQRRDLEDYHIKSEAEEQRKLEREKEEKEKELSEAKAEYDRKRIENAVKLIQQQYETWKENGGGKKKKKKKA